MDEWNLLYDKAKSIQGCVKISKHIKSGEVAAALLTSQGNIYLGVSISGACAIGLCAEKNAIANMITNGESTISKIVAVSDDGRIISPCCVCRQCMMQLGDAKQIQVMISSDKICTLAELAPNWWAENRIKTNSN